MSHSPDLAAALAAFQSGDLKSAQALAEQPFDDPAIAAQARHLLGLVRCRLGDLPTGIVHLAAAADAEPANAAFRLMLARALIDSGRGAEVLAMPEPPRDAAPPLLALWHARAEAADAAGQNDAAIDAWRVLAEARPSDWRAWSNLGNALAAAEQWDGAIEALRSAALLSPRDAAIRRNLAAALCKCGRTADGATELAAAVGFEPGNLEARLTLARLLTELGREEEALQQLDQALKVTPATAELARERGRQLVRLTRFDEAERDYTAALAIAADDRDTVRELGLLLERTNRLDTLRELLDGAETAGIARSDLSYLWAAIAVRERRFEDARQLLAFDDGSADMERRQRLRAKVADALGDGEAAFAAAAAMNRSVRNFDDWRRRGAKYRKWIRSIANVMTPDWIARLPVLPPGARPAPAFLVGFPRSGTTLLDTFLMGHAGIRVVEEQPMLETAKQVVGDFTMLAGCSPVLVERAREAYFAELDRHVDASIDGLVVDKLPLNMIGMPLVHALFSGARIVFAQRHPCDAVLSGFMQSFVMNDAMACFLNIEDAADLYDATMSLWWKSRELLPLNTQTLVYEELIADPKAALEPLIAFLGLEWSDRLLDHRSTAKTRGVISTPSYDQVVQPLSKAPVGRWRRYEQQLAPVLPVLLTWAKRLGYGD